MKQVVRRGLKEIVVEEVPDPTLLPHHVLVQPSYSLISSGTEAASIHNEGVVKALAENPSHLKVIWDALKTNGPVRTSAEILAKFSALDVMGYSGAGVVVDKHASVEDLEIGSRVAYGGEGTGHAETVIAGRNLVARVPVEVEFDQACFATLGAIAINAVRTARVGLGDVVAVIGLGLVGQLIAQLSRVQGGRVVGIDLAQDRIELAQALGAHHGVPGGAAAKPMVDELTNGVGADIVILAAAAKSAAPSHQALDICRDRGRIVVVGAVEMSFPWNDMYKKEIQLFMSRAYGPGSYDESYERNGQDYPISYVRWTENRNMEEFLRLVASGLIRVSPLISHRFPLEQAPEAYRIVMDPGTRSLAVVLQYPASSGAAAGFKPAYKVELQTGSSGATGSIGIGLLGSGNLARWQHLPSIRRNPNCRLVGIHSSNPVRSKSYARRFHAQYCTTDEGMLVQDPAIDAIVIVTRNQSHGRQALDALRAGKHVFVEKPLTLTLEEARELYIAVRDTRKVLTVGFNRRFAPLYRAVKKQLSKRSGPAVINCRVNSPGISGDYWMADPKLGGAILGEACHFVDLMYWLLDAEPVEVSAYSLPTGRHDPVGENNLSACFSFSDGSVASLAYCTIGSASSGGERLEVFAQGVGVITENFKHLTIKKATATRTHRPWAEKGYRAQMDDFVGAILNDRPPQVTVLDGVRSTLGCLRLLESARERRPMKIDLSNVTE